MKGLIRNYLAGSLVALTLGLIGSSAYALTPLPEPDPQPGGFGLEAV